MRVLITLPQALAERALIRLDKFDVSVVPPESEDDARVFAALGNTDGAANHAADPRRSRLSVLRAEASRRQHVQCRPRSHRPGCCRGARHCGRTDADGIDRRGGRPGAGADACATAAGIDAGRRERRLAQRPNGNRSARQGAVHRRVRPNRSGGRAPRPRVQDEDRLVRSKDAKTPVDVTTRVLDLKKGLADADFVSVNLDLNPSTWHMIGRDALSCMKPSAYLINTSRGPGSIRSR
jgi:D-isomer specific 2-hydroxyacid dehydrogenase, NAD binding domain